MAVPPRAGQTPTVPGSSVVADLECEVSDGYVTLRGKAEWDFEAHRAAKIFAEMDGVRAVSNLVTFQKVAGIKGRGQDPA